MISLKNIFTINFSPQEQERKKVKLREIFIANIQIVLNLMDPKIHCISMLEINTEIYQNMNNKVDIFRHKIALFMMEVILAKFQKIE